MDAWTMGEAVIYVIWATKQLKLANCFFFHVIYIIYIYCNTFYLFHCRCVLPILVNIVRTQWDDHGIMELVELFALKHTGLSDNF